MNLAYKKILKATTLFGSVEGLNILINLLRTKLVALLIGPEGMGLNAIYNETRELVHTSTNFGLDTSGVRGVSQAYEYLENAASDEARAIARQELTEQVTLLRSWVLLLGLFGMVVCMLLARPLSQLTFGDYDHTWGYVILSPAVAFSTMTCGEMAVLKGLRRLKAVAKVSVMNVLAALLVTIPIYYVWGIDGVLPALLAFTFAGMAIVLAFGMKAHRYTLSFRADNLKKGRAMLGIGLVVLVSEGIAHVVTLGILSYLNNVASEALVGLYSAGFTLTMTYGGMLFAAMATDYFPRLSGAKDDIAKRNEMVKAQTKVMLCLIVPMMVAFALLMPYIVPLILADEFEAIIPMAQVAAIGLVFRAVVLCVNYLPLAMGDSKIYFVMNLIGALDMVVVIPGYIYGGLFGMGVALTAQNFLDMIISILVARYYYKIR